MKTEEQEIAIAEECGIKTNDGKLFYRWDGENRIPTKCPKYLDDLNAMQDVEIELEYRDLWRKYGEQLISILQREGYLLGSVVLYVKNPLAGEQVSAIANAPANLRAEACLRALGKWEESGL